MNIPIWDGKYRIKSDAYCYRLVEIRKREPKDEEVESTTKIDDDEYEVNYGYYQTIEYLFKDLVEKEKRENKCTTFDGYIKHLEKVNKQLRENLEKIAALIGHKKNFERIMKSVVDRQDEDEAVIGEEAERTAKKGRTKK